MNNSEENWTELLENHEPVNQFFESAPALGRCNLFSMQIDERSTALTLGIDLRRLPDKLLPEWEGKNLNAFVFFLEFANLQELDVDGWLYTPTQNVTIERTHEGRIRTEICGEGRFTAGTVNMMGGRAYRASSIP